MIQKKKLFTVIKRTAAVLWWCATIAVAILIIGIIGAKLRGEVPRFFGLSVVNIVSGSMEDTIPEGTYILLCKTDPEKIEVNDVICFYSDDPAIKGYPNTHRVLEIVNGENGLEFVTQGDANPQPDPVTAKADKLIGRHVTNLDGMTRFVASLEGNGMLVFMAIMACLCMAFMVTPMFLKSSEQKQEQEAQGENDPPRVDPPDPSDAKEQDP